MRAIVVGGSGQIGSWLLKVLMEQGHPTVGTYATTSFPGLIPLDAADQDAAAAWLRDQRPDLVFYPAGFTWVDACERDPDRAHQANCAQPLNLARVAASMQARFIYFSTDYVFDGRDGPYDESAPPHPLSAYGRSKLDAERALTEELGELALIARTTWVYGPERQGKNFAYQLARTLQSSKELVCPLDQVSTPSYGPDVAAAVVTMAEQGVSGIVHVAGPELLDRVAFARGLARGLGLDEGLVVGKPTAELGQVAERPLNSGLLRHRLESFKPAALRGLDQALSHFLAQCADPSTGWMPLLPPPPPPGGPGAER